MGCPTLGRCRSSWSTTSPRSAPRSSARSALAGYDVTTAEDGEEAAPAPERDAPELVVLDVLMPVSTASPSCRQLRRAGDATPVLMLTARDAVSDRVAGLDAGADDYLVKPFALEELLARVRALLRRTVNGDPHGVLRFADVSLDPATHEVRRGDAGIELTRTEFLLLELFLLNPRQVLPRSLIFERVWGYDFGPTSNSLEVYVGYLRRKLEAAGSRAVTRRCAASATRCASRELPRAHHARGGRGGGGRGRRRLRRRLPMTREVRCAARSTTSCASARGRPCSATPAGFAIRLPAPPLGASGTSAQIVRPRDRRADRGPAGRGADRRGDRAVAAGESTPTFRERDLEGIPVARTSSSSRPGSPSSSRGR